MKKLMPFVQSIEKNQLATDIKVIYLFLAELDISPFFHLRHTHCNVAISSKNFEDVYEIYIPFLPLFLYK